MSKKKPSQKLNIIKTGLAQNPAYFDSFEKQNKLQNKLTLVTSSHIFIRFDLKRNQFLFFILLSSHFVTIYYII